MTQPSHTATVILVDEVFGGGHFVRVLIEPPVGLEDVERTYTREEFAQLVGQTVDLDCLAEGDRLEILPAWEPDLEGFGHMGSSRLGSVRRIDDGPARRQVLRLIEQIPWLPGSRDTEGRP